MTVSLLYVLTELGYVLNVELKIKKKCSFENAFVEKSESSTWNKWLSQRIDLYHLLECSPSWICLVTITFIK